MWSVLVGIARHEHCACCGAAASASSAGRLAAGEVQPRCRSSGADAWKEPPLQSEDDPSSAGGGARCESHVSESEGVGAASARGGSCDAAAQPGSCQTLLDGAPRVKAQLSEEHGGSGSRHVDPEREHAAPRTFSGSSPGSHESGCGDPVSTQLDARAVRPHCAWPGAESRLACETSSPTASCGVSPWHCAMRWPELWPCASPSAHSAPRSPLADAREEHAPPLGRSEEGSPCSHKSSSDELVQLARLCLRRLARRLAWSTTDSRGSHAEAARSAVAMEQRLLSSSSTSSSASVPGMAGAWKMCGCRAGWLAVERRDSSVESLSWCPHAVGCIEVDLRLTLARSASNSASPNGSCSASWACLLHARSEARGVAPSPIGGESESEPHERSLSPSKMLSSEAQLAAPLAEESPSEGWRESMVESTCMQKGAE
mmetsp:Transcript_18831/g.39867  ORF Transcript_18831/g.39867 Transcript_18831/m.39867 type:complete len:430 (-) Transcript_18831:8-1297(-)